jgi:diguanylate cyclase (GGDEF)-like protein
MKRVPAAWQASSHQGGLGRWLVRAALQSSVLTLVLAAIGINASLYVWSRASVRNDAEVLARIAADNSAAALAFGDVPAAQDTLASLRASSAVIDATLLDRGGRVFARYRADGAARASDLHVDADVVQNGTVIGRLGLALSLKALRERTMTMAVATLVSAALALAVATWRLRRVRAAVEDTEDKLDRMAYIDPVTGLFNRRAANEYITALVERHGRDATPFALMAMDVDDFKVINDTLGHAAGDQVLREIGARLRDGLRTSDMIFRFGGDEFVVVCIGPMEDAFMERIADAALESLRAPLTVDSHELYPRASFGIAGFPRDAASVEELLSAADVAMYRAKADGKNARAIYRASMVDEHAQRLRIDTELRHALERGELVLHYQPIVDLRRCRVIGVEALVRWRHPQRGLLMPGDFIDVAESTGLIAELGGWVLRDAMGQQRRWQEEGFSHLFVAVNVSGQQFRQGLLGRQVDDALHLSGADPTRLHIEITEHTLVAALSDNVAALAKLRQRGVRVSIDDFGTGLSSLAYLRRLPIDKIKIDKSFLRDAVDDPADAAIVQAIATLAQALKLEVVAEGIETAAQCRLVTRLQCAQAQGFYFSRPVPAADLPAAIAGIERMAIGGDALLAIEGGT